jgi:alpha-glucosidase (family GH31 glycosyl hydrolase)
MLSRANMFSSTCSGTWKMSLGTDAEVGEAWIQQHARTFADGFATKGIAASDYFILPRHAWIGSWRYSAALWSGDIVSTFDELAIQVKVLQGVMMSGVSLWTTDIGGCKDRPHTHTHTFHHSRYYFTAHRICNVVWLTAALSLACRVRPRG